MSLYNYHIIFCQLSIWNLSIVSDDLEPRSRSAVAKFDYDGRSPSELTFKAGDVLTLSHRVTPDWWQGSLNEQEGLVADQYVTQTNGFDTSVYFGFAVVWLFSTCWMNQYWCVCCWVSPVYIHYAVYKHRPVECICNCRLHVYISRIFALNYNNQASAI